MSLKDKTNQEVIDLIKESTLTDPQKKKVVKTLEENKFAGADIVNAGSVDELKDMGFGYAAVPLQAWINECKANDKQSEAERIRAKVRESKKARDSNGNNNNKNNNNNNNQNGNTNSFSIRYSSASKHYITKNKFTMSTTISEFIKVLASNELGKQPEKTNVLIMSNIYNYQSKETFEEIDFNLSYEVMVSYKVVGGMAAMGDDEKSNNRERYPNWDNNKFEATLDQDCLLFDKDDNLRVKMPCGHVFGPQCIFQIIQLCAEDGKELGVSCPIPKCGKEWDFRMLIDAADLNECEIRRFRTIFDNRKASQKADIRICKGCSSVLLRPDDVLYTRVRCTGKDCPLKCDFCWVCGNPWQGGGFTICGNKGCAMGKINDVLQTCEEKVLVKESANYTKKCPVIRACPRCLTLVKYDTSCKHMLCWGCQKKFCFYCLSLQADNGSWPCNSYADQCEPKPRQSLK